MEKISRAEASAIGANKYFTGEPCKRGHVAQRYTQTCVCVVCQRENNDRQRPRNTLALQGVVPLTFPVHRDDRETAVQLLQALLAARGIKVTNLTASPESPATSAPARTEITDEQRLAMWTRVHGETIARQMLEMYRPTNGS